MNPTDIIDWKIASLTNGSQLMMTDEMTSYIEQNPEILEELNFIELFWHNKSHEDVQPSAQLDANFYQMLSRAQAAQSPVKESDKHSTLLSFVQQLFVPKALVQFASLALVFTLGFNLNQPTIGDKQQVGLVSLQQEVSSLNTMLALSMLEQSSASQRLSGVAYSKQSDLSDPLLVEKLMGLIATDTSTSVRLAAINRFVNVQNINTYTEQLLTLAITEDNALIQIALCRLLLNQGSAELSTRLKGLVKENKLPPEVDEIIQANSAVSFT